MKIKILENQFDADIVDETLTKTNLGSLSKDSMVNLERALMASDRMGGHIVQGHVDGTGRVVSIKPDGDSIVFRIRVPQRLDSYIVEKGFISVDGISLTVVKRGAASFTLAVIPYTLKNTNLISVSVGDRVNLEADILAKYVESLMGRNPETKDTKSQGQN